MLFGYGASGTDAARQIGYTTIGMLVGLVPFSIYFILLRGWYSLEDTRTPFFLSLALNAINVVLSIGLFYLVPTQWKVPALGLAFGLTYWAMMLVAWPVLRRRLGGMPTRETWFAVLRMLVAGAVGSAATLSVLWAGRVAAGRPRRVAAATAAAARGGWTGGPPGLPRRGSAAWRDRGVACDRPGPPQAGTLTHPGHQGVPGTRPALGSCPTPPDPSWSSPTRTCSSMPT